MTGEEPGLLGNLPRSRPGTRSEKRAGRADTTPRAGPSDPADGRRGAEPDDPVGDALRAAARAAGGGLRLADGLTRAVLRRLPRP